MEYPFKDLLPIDEVLEQEGYYKDWTHLDPEVFYSLTQISEYIKTKGFGVDVRLLIAQLAEHFGLKTTQVVDLGNLIQAEHATLKQQVQQAVDQVNADRNALETQFNQSVAQMESDKNAVIANATVDSEVILARGGYTVIGDYIKHIDDSVKSQGVNVLFPPRGTVAAKGDGVTDDTTAIQNMYDNLNPNEVLIIPSGKFRVNGLKFNLDNRNILCYGEFVQNISDTGICVEVSGQKQTISGVLKVSRVVSDYATDNVGLRIYNAYMNKLTVSVSNFKVNLSVYADSGVGTSYNDVTIINLSNGLTNLLIDTVSSDYMDGWVNENIFYGGRFGTYTSEAHVADGETPKQAAERSGITHIKIAKSHNNNNVFVKPSLEYHGITFIDVAGQYNTFISPRLEGKSVLIRWRTGSIYNDVLYPYHHNDFTAENFYQDGTRNHLHGRNFTDLEEHVLKTTTFKAHGDPTRTTAYDSTEGMFDAYNVYSNNTKNFRGRDVNGNETYYVTATGDLVARKIKATGPATWLLPTLKNGFERAHSNVDVKYKKEDATGTVFVQGEVRSTGALSTGAEIFSVPAAYAPIVDWYVPIVKRSYPDYVPTPAMIRISGGAVKLYNTSLVNGDILTLSNIIFPAK